MSGRICRRLKSDAPLDNICHIIATKHNVCPNGVWAKFKRQETPDGFDSNWTENSFRMSNINESYNTIDGNSQENTDFPASFWDTDQVMDSGSNSKDKQEKYDTNVVEIDTKKACPTIQHTSDRKWVYDSLDPSSHGISAIRLTKDIFDELAQPKQQPKPTTQPHSPQPPPQPSHQPQQGSMYVFANRRRYDSLSEQDQVRMIVRDLCHGLMTSQQPWGQVYTALKKLWQIVRQHNLVSEFGDTLKAIKNRYTQTQNGTN